MPEWQNLQNKRTRRIRKNLIAERRDKKWESNLECSKLMSIRTARVQNKKNKPAPYNSRPIEKEFGTLQGNKKAHVKSHETKEESNGVDHHQRTVNKQEYKWDDVILQRSGKYNTNYTLIINETEILST